MKNSILLLSLIALFALASNNTTGGATGNQVGEALFNKHCIACHPDARKLKSKNIIGKMRNPMSSMPEFDENKISNDNAKKIDDYIHQDFEPVANHFRNMAIRK